MYLKSLSGTYPVLGRRELLVVVAGIYYSDEQNNYGSCCPAIHHQVGAADSKSLHKLIITDCVKDCKRNE